MNANSRRNYFETNKLTHWERTDRWHRSSMRMALPSPTIYLQSEGKKKWGVVGNRFAPPQGIPESSRPSNVLKVERDRNGRRAPVQLHPTLLKTAPPSVRLSFLTAPSLRKQLARVYFQLYKNEFIKLVRQTERDLQCVSFQFSKKGTIQN